MGIDTKIKSMSFLSRDMGKTNFGVNVVAAILKFKMAAYTKILNVIFTCLIGFLDPENIGIATKIKFLWVSNIGKTKFGSNGVAAFLKCIFLTMKQGWAIRGVLIICSLWSCELVQKNSACGYFCPCRKNKVWVLTALLKPDHITTSPVVTSIQVSFLGHADISSWNRCLMSIELKWITG